MSLDKKTIGFIGAGAMAEAILKGMLNANLVNPENVWASDCNQERLEFFRNSFKINTTVDNIALVKKVDILVLAVKPFLIKDVLEETAELISNEQVVVSIAAGISTGYISKLLKEGVSVIRVMPNTPSLVQAGASAIAPGKCVDEVNVNLVRELFDSVGLTVVVKEQDIDAVTGLSGSGPAYMYLIVEALADAGVKAGLTRPVALNLAAQTMYGAAKMVIETGDHPALLKDKVTTPGGTTIAGLHTLEEGKLRAVLIDAVQAAVERSKELGG